MSLCLAETYNYRNWYNKTKETIDRGKASFNKILNSIKDDETECKLLNVTTPTDQEGKEYSSDQETNKYPCITAVSKSGDLEFHIDKDVNSLLKVEPKYQVAAEGGCWQYVLREIESLDVDKCGVNGEASRALIALAKTKCHFIRAGREFPGTNDGCILNPRNITPNMLVEYNIISTNPCKDNNNIKECENLKNQIVSNCTNSENMTQAAFSMYHADLNHIDDICFYLQSHEWNKKTETNINRLGESAKQIIKSHEHIESFLSNIGYMQQEQISKANVLSEWMDGLKGELADVFNILYTLKQYQRAIYGKAINIKITKKDFVEHFRNVLLYVLYALAAICFTAFESTTSIRPHIILAITIACLIEGMSFNIIHNWIKVPYDLSPMAVHGIWSRIIKWCMVLYIGKIWFSSVISFRSPINTVMGEISKLLQLVEHQQKLLFQDPLDPPVDTDWGHALEQFVVLYNSSDDESYEPESESCASESDAYDLGADSEDLVDEYLDSLARLRYSRQQQAFNTIAADICNMLHTHADILDLLKLDQSALDNFSVLQDSETNVPVDVEKLNCLLDKSRNLFQLLSKTSDTLHESSEKLPPSYTKLSSFFENLNLGTSFSHTVHIEHALYKRLVQYEGELKQETRQ
ncbi:GEX1-Brambleberry [Babesia duncani]|uniref:GEX1-Brambleberry n=2 Tax=Babesia duncani TaxID=323732 RepID=A0AAD9PN83_9APIC|nr:GEX1-Brambleberry [Babesia duncani]